MKINPFFVLLAPLVAAPVSGAEGPSPGPPPAVVENARSESDLTTVTLTKQAESRLAIELKPVETKQVTRSRVFGGDVIAPLSGSGEASIYSLFPSMSPTERVTLAGLQVDADALAASAKLNLEAAQIAFDRTEGLFKDGASTQKDLDDARALRDLGEAALSAAIRKRELLGSPVLNAGGSGTLWVRVPVYVGDIGRLQTGGQVVVGELAARPGNPGVVAVPVEVPAFSGGAGSATADLYFSMHGGGDRFRQGQRVGVTIPTGGSGESLTVPWSSVVTDINGGTWVYKNTAPQTYQRHRVQVESVAGGDAVLASGPAVGTMVATAGVAELFGTEFGVGK